MASKEKRHIQPAYPRVYLTEARIEQNLSGYEAAELLDIHPNYYYALENGRRGHNLSVRLFYEICKCFNVDANTLIEKEIRYQKEREIFIKHKITK